MRSRHLGAGFPVFGCLEPLVGMPVAVLRPFGPRGTVETPIARSHSIALSRPPHGILMPVSRAGGHFVRGTPSAPGR
jgi:hypothetical protein